MMRYGIAGGRKSGHEHKAKLRQHAGLIHATAFGLTLACDNEQVGVTLYG